ncbi:hypothetical protein GCM10022198_12770 [Klugiella xanthotipulae]
MAKIGGNDPTQYSYSAADSLKLIAENAARAVENQLGSRSSYVQTAQREFRGFFAQVFTENSSVASQSAAALVDALRTVAGFVAELRNAAKEEDQRRAEARAWEERQRRREEDFWAGAAHEVASWFGAEDDPQPPQPQPEPQCQADEVTVRRRGNPGTSGAGGGTSSAAPADLRSFQSGMYALNTHISGYLASLRTALSDYESFCNGKWGTLSAQSLVTAFQAWLDENLSDVEWAGSVAAAFEAAGNGVVSISDASISAMLAAAGVDVYRDDFTIGPFSAIGTPPTNGFSDDPVNTATGNFLEPETDLPFPGAAESMGFTRMYNSLDPHIGVFGAGWASILGIRLDLNDEGATFVMDDGRQITFPRLGNAWDRGVGENYWITEEPASRLPVRSAVPDHVLVVRNNTGSWWAFTLVGTWLGRGNGPGTSVTVVRDDTGQIIRLTHERGRFIEVEYVGERVAYVTASDGRRTEYLYDDARRLVGVQDRVGTRRYRWNDASLIDRVVSAAGVVECENGYDAQGRVIEQLTPYGRRVRFAYLRGRVTSVSDLDGSNANTWIADQKGRVVGIIDAEANRQSMAYDAHGNLVSVTERDGQVTVHAYDVRGRKIRTVTPEGADFTYAYDDFDRVTSVVTASGGLVAYEYANEQDRGPCVIVDPEGGKSLLEWQNGNLMRVTDPVGVTIACEYDACGDLVGVTNAAGDRARLVWDGAGRVTEAVSPGGNRTRYRYDDAGLLVTREDPDGAVWGFEHGVGGKVVATVDPLGARTEMEYGPHGEMARIVDPLGRVTLRGCDELGNIASLTLPDGAEWRFTHDALSRLRKIIDPAGGVWACDYDATGQPTATTDPTGVCREVSHSRAERTLTIHEAFDQCRIRSDEYGRPIRVEQGDAVAELVTYDGCGRPVEFLDAEGGLTRVERDLAGRVVQVTSPAGRVTRYEYDSCGRPVGTTDATGARTTLAYDADSRVIERTSPTGEVTRIDYDRMGRVLRERIPGVGVTRYSYDSAGRLTGAQDSRYGRRRFTYDAAGQLTEAMNGVGGVTRYEYDDRGRVVRITDPVGGVTTRNYNECNRVGSQSDPLGRVTTSTYDAAGRRISQSTPHGRTMEWVYDAAGREAGVRMDGRWVSQTVRDARARTTSITDHTRPAAAPVVHTLQFDRLGRLVQRTTDCGDDPQQTRWEYDADGTRVALITPMGARVTYTYDLVGRLVGITHPGLGKAYFDYDPSGRTSEVRSGELLQSWEYQNGYPVRHARTDAHGARVTSTVRDDEGRITEINRPDGTTVYRYDDACQLLSATSGGIESAWMYDQSGRLTAETVRGCERFFRYDEAGQLLSVRESGGVSTDYAYDGQGHRVRATIGDCAAEYEWDDRGWLAGVRQHDVDTVRETRLWVNALGELADIDGTALTWDAAAVVPSLLSLGGTAVFQGPAGLTGSGSEWRVSGWRAGRATDVEDPWQVLDALTGPDSGDRDAFPAGISFGADGGLRVAGLDWMGARVYDPATRGFLSVDPLAPVTGAAWSGNPYSYAGNDPLHAIDPHGLAPITDAELRGYADSLQGPLAQAAGAAGHWLSENWEYIVGGLAIVAGVALMFTGVGGPVGMMLIGAASGALVSGGVSVVTQKATTGTVDWGEAGKSALIGAAGGAVGGGVAGSLARGARVLAPQVLLADDASTLVQVSYAAMRNTAVRTAIANGSGNAASNTLNYGVNATDHTPLGYLQSLGTGFATGAGGSYLTNRFGGSINNRLGEELLNRLGGMTQNVVNENIRAGGDTAVENLVSVGLLGFVTGGTGPVTGVHSAGY